MTKLGDLLLQRLQEEASNPLVKMQREAREAGNQALEDLNFVLAYFEDIKQKITFNINLGNSLPVITIGKTSSEQTHINSLLKTHQWNTKPNSYYNPIWINFVEWAKSENLFVEWTPKHDGGGRESWFELTITPLNSNYIPKQKTR